MRALSKKDRRRIVADYKTMSAAELAKAWGVSWYRLRGILEGEGATIRANGRPRKDGKK